MFSHKSPPNTPHTHTAKLSQLFLRGGEITNRKTTLDFCAHCRLLLLEKLLTKTRECRGVNQKADDQLNIFTKEEGKLSGRRDELVATKDEVENTLAVLDNKKTEQILYTYRQLYRNFATVFKELVPAGQGELLLTGNFDSESDGEQLEAATGLSTSVTFAGDAEPRRNMEQLSGGQKTLVALAFILAIQRCDPAPFYLFDEVKLEIRNQYNQRT